MSAEPPPGQCLPVHPVCLQLRAGVAARPAEPPPCLQPSRQWPPRCREQWPWRAARCLSLAGPSKASLSNTCWSRVGAAQSSRPPAQFSSQIQKPPPGRGVVGRGPHWSGSWPLLQAAPRWPAKLGMSHTPQPSVRSQGSGAEAAA